MVSFAFDYIMTISCSTSKHCCLIQTHLKTIFLLLLLLFFSFFLGRRYCPSIRHKRAWIHEWIATSFYTSKAHKPRCNCVWNSGIRVEITRKKRKRNPTIIYTHLIQSPPSLPACHFPRNATLVRTSRQNSLFRMMGAWEEVEVGGRRGGGGEGLEYRNLRGNLVTRIRVWCWWPIFCDSIRLDAIDGMRMILVSGGSVSRIDSPMELVAKILLNERSMSQDIYIYYICWFIFIEFKFGKTKKNW